MKTNIFKNLTVTAALLVGLVGASSAIPRGRATMSVSRPTTRRLAALAVVALAAGLGPLSSPAGAAPVTVRVAATSATNSLTDKAATAVCPTGKKLVGTGANVNSGGGQVRVYQIEPAVNLNHVTVRAIEQPGGTTAEWSVTAYAVCTSLNLTGLKREIGTSAFTSASPKSATVNCPPGKTLLGTAAMIVPFGVQGVVIDDIVPHPGLNAVTVWAFEGQGGTPADWSVRAFAICDSVPSALVSRIEALSSYGSSTARSAQAQCPRDWTLVGTGAAIDNGGGQVMIDDITPNGSVATTPTAVAVQALEDQDGTLAAWRVRAYAICFAPPEG